MEEKKRGDAKKEVGRKFQEVSRETGVKQAGEWERDLEKKLIRPVTGKKPLILNKSPYNPGGFFCSAATLCVRCSVCMFW